MNLFLSWPTVAAVINHMELQLLRPCAHSHTQVQTVKYLIMKHHLYLDPVWTGGASLIAACVSLCVSDVLCCVEGSDLKPSLHTQV